MKIVRARRCASCSTRAKSCAACNGPADLHEHVYGEWWCRSCWGTTGEPDHSQDADCFAVIERS